MLKKLTQILSIIFLVSGCTKQLMVKDYFQPETAIQMFGQIPERTFYYPVELTDSLELKWEESTKGSFGNNSVLFEDNYLFVTDLAGNLFCFLADTGSTVGADKLTGEIAISPVLNAGWIYYVNTIDGEPYSELIRYNIREGERMNDVRIPGRVSAEMIKFNDGLFVINEYGLAQFYNDYLEIIWENDLEKKVFTSPAANSKNIFIATLDGNIISLDKTNGEIAYQKNLSDGFESAITINNMTGYLGDIEGNLIAFDLENGSEIWRNSTHGKIVSPPVLNKNYIYVSNLAGSIFCCKLKSGEEIWNYKSDGIFNTPPALFENVLLQPDLDEKLLFIEPFSGELLKTWKFDDRVKLHPVYYNGMLYIGIDRGELLAYKLVKDFE